VSPSDTTHSDALLDWRPPQRGTLAPMAAKPHDPAKPVSSKEELQEFLLAGLESGEPKPVTEQDWEAWRRRALANTPLVSSASSGKNG
jgi:hypothetical protein